MPDPAKRASAGGTVTPLEAGAALFALLRRCQLTRREQRVIAAVLGAGHPLTVLALAKRTGLHYSHCKAVVRGLVAWNLLERTSAGLRFQPDSARWGPPRSGGVAFAKTGPISVPATDGHE
jgi:hypothetical protein